MSYFSHHVFVCTNLREPNPDGTTRPCCAAKGSVDTRDYMKKRIKKLGLAGAGKIRLNNAGCLDRCEEGPCVVIYPEGVWYTFFDRADVDEIIDSHLLHGKIVERLRLPDHGIAD
jgi:(2Fe-2S) ferredoxin